MLSRDRWQKIKAFSRPIWPWIDPGSYWSLGTLFLVAMAILLGPLAFDVAKALFFAIPSGIRVALAHLVIVALIAAAFLRLWHVKATDSWPSEHGPDGELARTPADRWVPWALRLAVLSLALPMLRNPDGLGFSDWDFYLEHYEVLRRTVLDFGQFPWWNPWSRGGFPLAAHPQISPVSIAAPLVIVFGTTIGLGLSAILCLLIAVEGTYRLAWLWFREPWAAAAAALVYGLNGGVIVNVSVQYILSMSYCSVPWLAYFAFRLGRRFRDGAWFGCWLAFLVNNGIQYTSLFCGPLTAMVWARAFRLQPPERRAPFLSHTLAAVGVFLLLCGWRLSTVLLVFSGDKRERVTFWDETPLTMLHYLLSRPSPTWTDEFDAAFGTVYSELTCYVGPLVLMLALVSVAFGWRWWHTLTFVCFWLAIGSVKWYQPSYWLADWPLFGSAHVVTRWRYLAMLGLGMAVGNVLARWRMSRRRGLRALAVLLVGVVAADYVALGHQQFPLVFRDRPKPADFPGPPVPDIVNVGDGLGYPCAQRGYGVVRGYEPMLSYYRNAPTLRRAREDPDYRGEAWTDDGPIAPVVWSPNHLVFQVKPHQPVHLNQNPGSWWWVNDRQAFPGRRFAELTVPFDVMADAQGRVDLRIHPRGLAAGIALHIVGAGLLVLAWLARRRLTRMGFPPEIRKSHGPAMRGGRQSPAHSRCPGLPPRIG